jgi:MASE9
MSLSYLLIVSMAGAWVLAASIGEIARREYGLRIVAWTVLALLTVVVGRLAVRLPFTDNRVSFSDAMIFLSLLAVGPHLAVLTGAIDGCAASRRSCRVWYKRVFNTAAVALAVFVASRLFALLASGAELTADGPGARRTLLPVLAAAAVFFAINTTLVSIAAWLCDGIRPERIWRLAIPWTGTACLAGALAAAFVYMAVRLAGPMSFLVILPFPIVLYLTYRASLRAPVHTNVPTRG